MAKKTGAAALQTEVTTDDEWRLVLERKGLVVVDVYSEWSGPCLAMVSTLKKIKMELGGDLVSYAVARNDEISSLERFRGKSEPVWIFLQDGKMVNLMFGAHCPNLQRLLTEEIRRVQQAESPKWIIPVDQRCPEEETRWQEMESIRKALEEKKKAKEDAEKKAKYEIFLSQMMAELCEETALLLYPWVFKDDDGNYKDKDKCPAYAELVHELLPDRYDVVEEVKILLNEEMVEKMMVESNLEITEEILKGLTDGKCMALRLKGKPPQLSWPVPFPHECPEELEICPIRAVDDVENYLNYLLNARNTSTDQPEEIKSYMERHTHVQEADPNVEGDTDKVYPAAWTPPQARSKVHVLKTIFSNYMEKAHPYEEPVPPLPINAFKYEASKLPAVTDAYTNWQEYVVHFGAFEFDDSTYARRLASTPEDFENKVKHKTGGEVFIVIIRRAHDEAFLAFAGIEPYFLSEDNDEAEAIGAVYFPAGAVDLIPQDTEEEEEEE
ncbi:uncharacterized protein LOC107269952, partial [Cephus cinctus]|uniref:Uncharacterized protein LOC107269952 n=1 Tax=Cephus cinctus TaxID=211228 RepID=A0AAJ7RL12_CEPCN